jgi:hypothetical protein
MTKVAIAQAIIEGTHFLILLIIDLEKNDDQKLPANYIT